MCKSSKRRLVEGGAGKQRQRRDRVVFGVLAGVLTLAVCASLGCMAFYGNERDTLFSDGWRLFSAACTPGSIDLLSDDPDTPHNTCSPTTQPGNTIHYPNGTGPDSCTAPDQQGNDNDSSGDDPENSSAQNGENTGVGNGSSGSSTGNGTGNNGSGNNSGNSGNNTTPVWHPAWDEWVVSGYWESVSVYHEPEWGERAIWGVQCRECGFKTSESIYQHQDETGHGGFFGPVVIGYEPCIILDGYYTTERTWMDTSHWVHHEGYWE